MTPDDVTPEALTPEILTPETLTPAALAAALLDLGAVALRPAAPFTWASGWRSPVYTDNRRVLGDVRLRRAVRDAFARAVRDAGWAPNVVAGTATAGIPHAAWLADALALPMAYVRGSAKAHGTGSRIEGADVGAARVVLVEDLVSTGGSSLAAVEALREAGAEVVGVVALFSYGFPTAATAFAAARVPLVTLTGYDALVAAARARGDVSDADLATLAAWRRDPAAWGR